PFPGYIRFAAKSQATMAKRTSAPQLATFADPWQCLIPANERPIPDAAHTVKQKIAFTPPSPFFGCKGQTLYVPKQTTPAINEIHASHTNISSREDIVTAGVVRC